MKNYQWREAFTLISGGYVGEETGVIGLNTNWVTSNSASGSSSADYYYRDSDFADNARSSRVVVTITDHWNVSIDSRNYLHVSVTSTVDRIVRDDLRGSTQGNIGRNLRIKRGPNAEIIWQALNDPINNAHTILSTPLTLATYNFSIEPGENKSRQAIYFRSNTVGHDDDPTPNIYTDEMWMGVEFKNILPKDYRPGATLKSNNEYAPNPSDAEWMSHDRTNKAAHVLASTSPIRWQEMRTIGGDEGQKGNPPLILTAANDSSWRNQKLLGKD